MPGTMKSEMVLSDKINDGSLNETYNDEVAGIKFAILFNDLADHFPEEKFQKLKDLIQSSKKVKNIKSLNEARSARDCIRILDSENLFTKSDVTFVQFLLRMTECKDLENKCVEYAKGQRALGFYEKQPEDGFKHVYFHVTGDLSNFNKEKKRNIIETVAAMVGCKTDRVSLNGYRRSESFIAIVSIEVIYFGKLVAINKQDRYRFVRLDIDYFTVDFVKVILKISQESQRVDYHEHVQKTKQHRIIPPRKSVFVPSTVRVDTSTRFLHKMKDEESVETSLKSQRVDYHEHVQKTKQHRIIPPRKSVFLPSKSIVDTSTKFFHKMEDEEFMETSLLRVDTLTRFLHKMEDEESIETSLSDLYRITESERVDYHDLVQESKSHRIIPPQESTFVPSKGRFDTSTGFLHKMEDEESIETSLSDLYRITESERVDHHDLVQKSKSHRIIPPQESTFVPSKGRFDTSTGFLHKMEDEESIETSLKLPFPKRFEYNAHLRSSIRLSTFGIKHISCFKPNRLWLSVKHIIKEIDEDGHLLRELSVNLTDAGCHTLSKAGDLLFKKDNGIYMLSSSGEIRNLHIHANELSCIHSSRLNGDIFVGEEEFIKRYNDKGVNLQTISTFKFMERSGFSFRPSFYPNCYCKITENINGDIVTIVDNQVVAFKNDGEHKFTYSGEHYGSEFYPLGLCNDTFGHILVPDLYQPCVHLLDINGYGLTKLPIHKPYLFFDCNALCVDEKNNLYVARENKIDVYTYLSGTTVTEHDAMVIDSEFPCDM